MRMLNNDGMVKLRFLPSNNFVRLVVFIAVRPRNEAETVFLYKRFRTGHGATREFTPFSPNDSIYLHEQFNREHLHPHAVSNFPTFNEKPFIHFSFFPRRILTTDRATRLRGRNTCSKLAPTSRRRKKKAEVASKRIE